MSFNFFKFLIKQIHLLPTNFFSFWGEDKINFIKSEALFNIIEYKSNYKNDNFAFFFLPLFFNVCLISNDIQKILYKKKVISIISILIFSDNTSTGEYIHSLSNSNKLYSLDNFNEWVNNLLINIIEKLELYKSFEKVSLVIKVKTITTL